MMNSLAKEMQIYPSRMADVFNEVWDAMAIVLEKDQMETWAQAGLKLASLTVRSWEAAEEYFRVSPRVVKLISFNYFVKWSEYGSILGQESPSIATAYFSSSPKVMVLLRSRHIDSWANLGKKLHKGTWKSSTLSCKFFEASPILISELSIPDLGRFMASLDSLSIQSHDLSIECLEVSQKLLPLLGSSKDSFLSLLEFLCKQNWRQIKGLFEALCSSLPKIGVDQRLAFINLVSRLFADGYPNVPSVINNIAASIEQLNETTHPAVMELAEKLLDISPPIVPEFFKSCPTALSLLSINQLGKWCEIGIKVQKDNGDAGLAYFRMESASSQEVMETLSSSIEFRRIKDVMELYCRALAGSEITMAVSEELAEKGIGWVSEDSPSTEGSTVFVPSQSDHYPTKNENFEWFKVVATHQVAHLEFGSFLFKYIKPSTQFKDMRPLLGNNSEKKVGFETQIEENSKSESLWATDLQRFFNIFEDRKLALDIFTVVEDGRLDTRVKNEYPGINAAYNRVQNDSLHNRPDINTLPAREAMMEFLIRISLQVHEGLSAPKQYVDDAQMAGRIALRAVKFGSTVEDTAEATLRIYPIIAGIPNTEVPDEDWDDVNIDTNQDEPGIGDRDQELLQKLIEGMSSDKNVGEELEYSPNQEVDYRGNFKPELVQLLEKLRVRSEQSNQEPGDEEVTQEMLEGWLQNSAELDINASSNVSPSSLVNNVLKEVGLELPKTTNSGQGPSAHVEEEGGSLEIEEPSTFVYDEWDFRANDYKPRWCVVKQKIMEEGDSSYYSRTLHSYGPLVHQIKRQFELMVPEMFKKVRKLEDGDEIDIDDVIEAYVDIHTGAGPSEKLYWRRNKVQRDVAVVFLLDTSASTAEAIDESTKISQDWHTNDDPLEYMAWLKDRREQGNKRTYKRIIDLEKEAIVLLIHALETIGDVYGIYGFSGYGRENVEFFTVKDVNEEMSEKVKSRIDRIAPLHATRMGPAIRHATTKLDMHEARTKLLFLISDGRPQDRGYSREGVEKEYAVHDTKMALDEAIKKHITPFCLTVDKNGHDYLKTMCEDMGYEILDDIYSLPKRLIYLYRSLTM